MSAKIKFAANDARVHLEDAERMIENATKSLDRVIELAGRNNSNSTDMIARLFDHAISHSRLSGYVMINCAADGRHSVSSPFHGLCCAAPSLRDAIKLFVDQLRANGYATDDEADKILNG